MHSRVGIVEQPAQNRGRAPERQTRNDAERPPRQRDREEVAGDDPHAVAMCASDRMPQAIGPDRIELDRDHLRSSTRERGRDRSAPSANLDDEIAGGDAGGFDEAVCELSPEEVLPETAPALVSGGPPTGGHGTSRCSSRPAVCQTSVGTAGLFVEDVVTVPVVDTFEMIAHERRGLADVLAGLDTQQWSTPSLCQEWTVHDVASHLLMPLVTSIPRFMVAMVGSGFSFDRANVKLTAAVAQRSNEELVSGLRANAEHRFKPPGLGPEAPLTDILIHGQDIRRPLGIHRDFDREYLRRALTFLAGKAPGFIPKGLVHGVRFEATDLEWASGEGAPARGPGEAILLTMTGRRVALADLDGPGVDALRTRFL